MARGGRVFLERLGTPPEGVPMLEQGRPGHCCLCPGSASMTIQRSQIVLCHLRPQEMH